MRLQFLMQPEDRAFLRVGGSAVVQQLVHRIFELLDNLPELNRMRQRFDADLMRTQEITLERLLERLGDPAAQRDLASVPLPLPENQKELRQWRFCIQQAVSSLGIDHDIGQILTEELTSCRVPQHSKVA